MRRRSMRVAGLAALAVAAMAMVGALAVGGADSTGGHLLGRSATVARLADSVAASAGAGGTVVLESSGPRAVVVLALATTADDAAISVLTDCEFALRLAGFRMDVADGRYVLRIPDIAVAPDPGALLGPLRPTSGS